MPECAIGNVKIHVEIPVFLLFFAFAASIPISGNFVIYRTCYLILGYNQSECLLLGSTYPDNETAILEKAVEPHSTIISMVSTLTQCLTSAVFCLFAGPWSDRFGRKPIMTLTVLGQLLSYLATVVVSVLDNASPWYLLLCSIPVALTGGTPSYLTVVLCYITDLTSEANRGMRMASFEASLFLGIFLGTVSSSYIFEATSYTIVFVLSATCCLLNLLFTLIFIPESLPNKQTEARVKGFFQMSNVTDMVKITFKKRQNYARCIILSCIVMTMLSILVRSGNDTVMSLYLRAHFHWSLQKCTLFQAAYTVIPVVGTVLGVYILHKVLKISETILLPVSLMSSFSAVMLMGFARTDWTVYSVAVVRILGEVFGPMVQSLVSKIVPNDEIGKILALVIASQFLLNIAASPIYTFIYNSTIETYPATFIFVNAGIYLVLILIAVGLVSVKRVIDARNNYNLLINEDLGQAQSSSGDT